MGRKRILPEHIRSIQTSFDDLSGYLSLIRNATN